MKHKTQQFIPIKSSFTAVGLEMRLPYYNNPIHTWDNTEQKLLKSAASCQIIVQSIHHLFYDVQLNIL